MALLKKDQILGADDIAREVVPVPEWGGEVLVRGLTGAERDHFEMLMLKAQRSSNPADINLRAHLAALTIVGEDGERLFKSEGEVVRLGKKSGRALDRVFDVAQRLSGVGPAALELAVGNSGGATGDAPSSASGSPSADFPTTSSPA